MAINVDPTVFNEVNSQLSRISSMLGVQGISQIIQPFSGEPSEFRNWVKSIEKYAASVNLDNSKISLIAYQGSNGYIAEFIHRYLNRPNPGDWPALKKELSARFAEISDPQHALALLKQIRQHKNEGIPVFAERLLTIAEEAFPGPNDGNQAVIEGQLIGFFTDGLIHNSLRMKLMRENPKTLQDAINCVMKEHTLRARFQLRTGQAGATFSDYGTDENHSDPEAMEVDLVRPRRNCYTCNKPGHLARDCRQNRQTRAVHKKTVNEVSGRPTYKTMTCYNCGELGHGKFNCPQIMCFACGQGGHIRRNCRNTKRGNYNQGN